MPLVHGLPAVRAVRRRCTQVQRAIWYAATTLVCMDVPGFEVMGRLWCLYEMFYTLINKTSSQVGLR